MSGRLYNTLASGKSGEFTATRGDVTIWLGIDSGNVNHGIYSGQLSDWMVYSDGTSVTLNGNATSATYAKTANTDSTNRTLYPVGTTSSSTTSAYTLYKDSDIRYITKNGVAATDTTSAVQGYALLVLGNSTDYEAAGGTRGAIRLYAPNSYYIDIRPEIDLSANRALCIPALGGTRYIVNSSTRTALGGVNQPIYLAAEGLATTCNTFVPTTGGSFSGPITFANNTWNPIGDDAALGDHNQAGAVCFKALNHNETSLMLYNPSETATGIIKLDGSNNLILYADGGIVYSAGTLGVGGAKNIYFDTTAVSRGIAWHHYQSGKTAPHLLQFISGANDEANAANGYWGDIQMHANSDTSTNMYVTRWQDGVEQGRICLLDQWNNTWKTSGSFYLQNSGSLVCEWNNNGTMQTGITVWADGEGGNIEFFSPNGNRFQMDAYNGNWRLYGVVNNAYAGEITVTPYGQLYGAVWNDYAEYRETKYEVKPGHAVSENGDDTLSQTYKRLQPACSIVSDTYGFAIGETEKCKTPLAIAGRVLAYPYEDRDSYKPGDAVCSGPNGTVSKMTCQEKVMYPECIVGYVSCVPDYEVWGEKNTKVDGRIWIKVR